MDAAVSLVVLAVVLSLDNFRIALALGTYDITWRRALRVALVFGIWDAVSPLVGLLVGRYFGDAIGPLADAVGPVVLLVYGLYLVVQSLRTETPDDLDERVILFGMPLSLSLDNLLAGTGLGMLGFPALVTALVFGGATALMTLVGLRIGSVASRLVPIRGDLLCGVSLLLVAVFFLL